MSIFILFLIYAIIPGQQRLKGELYGVLGPGTYIVEDDIAVPADRVLTVRAGTVFLFNGFFGLRADGGLFIEGTPQNRVIFTSIKDPKYGGPGAQPMDWNHVEISDSAPPPDIRFISLFYTMDGVIVKRDGPLLESVYVGRSGANRVSVSGRDILPGPDGFVTWPARSKKGAPAGPFTAAEVPDKKEPPGYLKWIALGGVSVCAGLAAWYYLSTD